MMLMTVRTAIIDSIADRSNMSERPRSLVVRLADEMTPPSRLNMLIVLSSS